MYSSFSVSFRRSRDRRRCCHVTRSSQFIMHDVLADVTFGSANDGSRQASGSGGPDT